MSARKIRVIGVGAPGAGDDAIGLEAAAMVRSRLPDAVDVVSDASGGANIAAACEGVDVLVIIDAVRPTQILPPGATFAWSYPAMRWALELTTCRNTHSFSVAEGLALAEQLGMLPKSVMVFGMAGENFEPGAGLSATAKLGMNGLVELVLQRLGVGTAPELSANRTDSI